MVPQDSEHFARDSLRAAVGQRFTDGKRKYELKGKIADGAIGVVRKAEDLVTGETDENFY